MVISCATVLVAYSLLIMQYKYTVDRLPFTLIHTLLSVNLK